MRQAPGAISSAVEGARQTAESARGSIERAMERPAQAPAPASTPPSPPMGRPASGRKTTSSPTAASAGRAAERAAEAALGINRSTPVDQAAFRLANDLRAVPGIERFSLLRLGELDRSGPRPLRTLWRIARENLDDRYGNLTIGEVLEMYKGGGSTPIGQ
jgi:hypothetical protein